MMIGSFHDDFVCAYAVHVVEHAFGRTVQVSFDGERRKLVGHHPHSPTLRVAAGAVRAICQHLGGSLALVTGTEWTKTAFDLDGFADEISRTLGTISGYDDPSSDDGIFAQLWHSRPSPEATVPILRLQAEFRHARNCVNPVAKSFLYFESHFPSEHQQNSLGFTTQAVQMNHTATRLRPSILADGRRPRVTMIYRHQTYTLLQHVKSDVRLLLADNQRRRQPNRVRAATQQQDAALECQLHDTIALHPAL